jgi:hypothetical protein
MRPRVIAAQAYVDEHRDLEQLGMPIEIARHALDRKTIETEPIAAIRGWDGKGLLGLHHARDNGKTHAAALWVRRRRRQGKRTAWLSCPGILGWDDLDAALRRTVRAPAVVLDDVGPGLGGTAGFQSKLAAWAQERGHLPTILTSNANTAQLEQYLGPRLMSRMRQAGQLVSFEAEAGLRQSDPEQLDEDGRGVRWGQASWLLWRLGCEPDDHVEAGRVVRGHRVGDKLETARLPLEELDALAMRWGLSIEAVDARHGEIEAQLDGARELMTGWTPPTMERQSSTMDRIKRLADEDIRAAKTPRGSPPAPELGKPAAWASKSALRDLGFEVTRKRPGTKAKSSTYRVLYKGAIVHAGIADEAEGWRIAAGVLGPETLAPGSCSSPDYYQRTQAIRDAAMARRGHG